MIKTFSHPRVPAGLLLVLALALLAACAKKPSSRNYFPETGGNALYQRSLDLRSNLKVLSIALRPGYEDLVALAYFRLGRGAAVMSVYVTNGEAGESDVQGQYPTYLAATRRAEAAKAMAIIGSDIRFLNLSDIVAARDSAQVRELWPSDSLQLKLGQVISYFQPDLILLNRDWSTETAGLPWEVLRADLLATVKNDAAATTDHLANGAGSAFAWKVSRVAVDSGRHAALAVPVNERQPRWKKSYEQIGEEAAQAYVSLSVQRKLWRQGKTPSYVLVYPAPAPTIAGQSSKRIDEGLPAPVSQRLRGLEIQIEALTDKTLSGKTREALPRVAALIDSVDFTLAQQSSLRARERKSLLHWKRGLENLRCTLLGVEVNFTVTDTLLADRQLTYIYVNEVKGLSQEGKTEILFAGLDQNWAVNEDYAKMLPLAPKQEYRLITPEKLVYNYPPALRPFQSTIYAKSVPMFIIHSAKAKERSFLHRSVINLDFAPKFVAEVLTPIVRMVPEERLVFRLMNISRDGVADTIEVVDPLVQSFRHPFRLSTKGASTVDTLTLAWSENVPDGTYIIPVKIDTFRVAQFAARKFSAETAGAKRVGLLTGIRSSPMAEALRRLQADFSVINPGRSFAQQIEALNVIIIDRRALTLQPEIAALRPELDRFVERGGHLIVLAQDAEIWNAQPLWNGLRLAPSFSLEANAPLAIEASHPLLNQPNHVTSEDWDDWLYLRGYNAISGELLATAGIPLRAMPEGSPLIVTAAAGQGKRTYVDLALHPQLMNIHPGAFRLLANLISY
jgi:hypothetical protein